MPANWTNLILDVKLPIIKLLDYEARCNLRLCSKLDKSAVDSTKFKPKFIQINRPNEPQKNEVVITMEGFQIYFIGKDTTIVERYWNGVEVIEFRRSSDAHPFEEAKRFLERLSVNGVIEAEEMLFYPGEMPPMDHWLFKCSHLEIVERDTSLPWLQKFHPSIQYLNIDAWGTTQISKLPQILTPSTLIMYMDTDINDESLKRISATYYFIKSMDITIEGLKFAVENFLRFGRREDVIEFEVIIPEGVDGRELVPRGCRMEVEIEQIEGDAHEGYVIKIFDGFRNVHGLEGCRLLEVNHFGSMVVVTCSVTKD